MTQPPEKTAERTLARRWRRGLAGAGGIAALALATGMELHDRRTAEGTPPVAIGERVDLGPYAVTLLGAELHRRFPDDPPSADRPVLWLRLTAENLTSATRTDLGEYLRPGGDTAAPVRAESEAGLFIARDGTRGAQLQPALPETIVLAAAAPEAGSARVTLFSARWKARDALAGLSGWYGLKPKATATLPVPTEVRE